MVLVWGYFNVAAYAQSPDTLTVSVYFKQGSSVVDRAYCDNGLRLDSFISKVNSLHADSLLYLHSVRIMTSASPEGSLELNEKISHERGRNIRDYILSKTLLSPVQVKVRSVGVDWDMLLELSDKYGCPWIDSVREILISPVTYTTYKGQRIDSRKSALQSLEGGRCWEWMYENIFFRMRSAAGNVRCIVYNKSQWEQESVRDTVVVFDTVSVSRKDTVVLFQTYVPESVSLGKESHKRSSKNMLQRKPVFAFRSNLLVPLLNVGMEVPIGNRFSIGADVYAPWVYRELMNKFFEPQKYCMQGLAGQFELRWWLGKEHGKYNGICNRLSGHSLALVADAGKFDVEWDWKGTQGEFAILGLDYTYALPVAKGKARIEFSLGVGYGLCRWRPYEVFYEGGYLIAEKPVMLWQGPVVSRLGISLVVPVFSSRNLTGRIEQ